MNQEQLDNSADLPCDKLLKTFQTLGKIQHDIYKYMLLWLSLEKQNTLKQHGIVEVLFPYSLIIVDSLCCGFFVIFLTILFSVCFSAT